MDATIQNPMAILSIFFLIIISIFQLNAHPRFGRLLKYIPPIAFAYFVPTALTTMGILPDQNELYGWIKTFMLPVALFLFTIALDLKAIMRLGFKAVVMMVAGTAGIVIGGPIALLIFKAWLPQDAWMGMAALSGSWIGGGANFVAIGQAVGASPGIMGPIIVVDTVVASTLLGVLIYFAGRHEVFDRWMKADTSSITEVQNKIEKFQTSVARVSSFNDLVTIIGFAFIFTFISFYLGKLLPPIRDFVNAGTWRVILITTFGVLLSFTKARNYEGAGASKLGNVALYLLITTIGAQANLRGLIEYPVLILAGVTWIAVHIVILLIVARLIRAPLFFLAVGSQANVGGAASAPVVAAAFHPALAPVGILLAILGYVLGTYAGLITAYLLRMVAGG
ncbi:MAG: DUF819 family protein [Bdellovibrionales bacterium]|nr:DUF819 family protein [Bdellovibrionales bacterium]